VNIERKTFASDLGDNLKKYTTRLFSADCEQYTDDGYKLKFNLLQAVTSNPGLADCGPSRFDTLKMYYDGRRWVLELSAVA
jgi:hypothetical protein